MLTSERLEELIAKPRWGDDEISAALVELLALRKLVDGLPAKYVPQHLWSPERYASAVARQQVTCGAGAYWFNEEGA